MASDMEKDLSVFKTVDLWVRPQLCKSQVEENKVPSPAS